MMLSAEKVVAATGAPAANVHANWPLVYAALDKLRIAGTRTQCAAVATIAVECPPFTPIAEWGEHPEYDTGSKAKRLGNTPEPDGDGQLFEGRGYLQLSGAGNYRAYGKLIGVDLEKYPDRALDPAIAAAVFALYFKWKKVSKAAEAGEWKQARRLVNGGLSGWARFSAVLKNLGAM